MSFTGELNAEMSNIARSIRNGADNLKLDGKIAEQQKKIKVLTKEIGRLTLVRLEAGDEMCPEIMERYSAICEAKEVIATLERDRRTTKAICPNCGAKTSVDMNYCGKCGASMKEVNSDDIN